MIGTAVQPALLLGGVLVVPWLWRRVRKVWWGKVSALGGLLVLGFAEGMLLWYGYSNWLITDVPQARSFAFGLPISFIGAFVLLRLLPVQPREKYQGLTLGTLGQPVLTQK